MAYDLENWYAALGTGALPSLFKWWTLVDPDQFYSKVKFGNLGVYMGKRQTVDFSAYDIKVEIYNQLNYFV